MSKRDAMTIREAGAEAMLGQLAAIAGLAPATAEGRDPEAIHKIRVATRRLRAAARAFGKGFDKEELAPIVEGVRRLARALGKARDADVFLEWIEEAALRHGGAAADALRDLKDSKSRERAAIQGEISEALAGEWIRSFVDETRWFLERAAWRQSKRGRPAIDGLRRVVKRKTRRLRDSMEQLPQDSGAAELHRLRIKAKRLRYTAEFLQGLRSKPGRKLARLIRRTTKLQDALGAIHDIATRRDALLESRDAGLEAAIEAERRRDAELRAEYGRLRGRL